MIKPTELYYSKDHIWTKVEVHRVLLGITDYVRTTLGEIVFLDLSKEGRKFINY